MLPSSEYYTLKHRLLRECMHACVVRLCDLMDYSLPGSSVQGIFQTRILEWVAISYSGDLSDPGIELTPLVFPMLASR